MTGYVTRFGSLESFEKGSIEIIDDEPRHYTFSNIFEVASAARPWEKVAVGKNMEYVVEVIRAGGPWAASCAAVATWPCCRPTPPTE